MILWLHIIPTALDFLFIVACIGLLAAELWVIPYKKEGSLCFSFGESGTALLSALHDDLWHLLGLVLAGLTLMGIIDLLLRTVEMSGLPWGKAFSVLPLVLTGTHYGMTWFVRMVASGALWLGWWLEKRTWYVLPSASVESRPFLYAMLLAMACIVWSVSASSHSGDWGDFTLPEWMGWLHIMAGSMWLGSILAFTLVIRGHLHASSRQDPALFATCASGLSRLAGMALALVLTTGAYNVWRQLGCFSDLWSSGYGRIILFKLALVSLMAAMGATSRYFNLPFLCHEAGVSSPGWQTGLPLRMLRRLRPSWRPRKGDALARQFGRRVAAEAWLVLGVLVCAALLGHTMPPKKHVDAIRHTTLQVTEERDWLSPMAQSMMAALMTQGEWT